MSKWLEILRDKQEDRGLMANLRCYLVESKKRRAYPALYRLGISVDSESKSITAALYAMHPVEGSLKNFGSTVKRIKEAKDNNSGHGDKQTPTERRFQHLLAAEYGKELHERVVKLVMLAKSCGVPVNYEQLQKDLKDWKYWNDRIRREWASEFWKIDKAPSGGDE